MRHWTSAEDAGFLFRRCDKIGASIVNGKGGYFVPGMYAKNEKGHRYNKFFETFEEAVEAASVYYPFTYCQCTWQKILEEEIKEALYEEDAKSR